MATVSRAKGAVQVAKPDAVAGRAKGAVQVKGAATGGGQPTMRRWGGVPGMTYTGRRAW